MHRLFWNVGDASIAADGWASDEFVKADGLDWANGETASRRGRRFTKAAGRGVRYLRRVFQAATAAASAQDAPVAQHQPRQL